MKFEPKWKLKKRLKKRKNELHRHDQTAGVFKKHLRPPWYMNFRPWLILFVLMATSLSGCFGEQTVDEGGVTATL